MQNWLLVVKIDLLKMLMSQHSAKLMKYTDFVSIVAVSATLYMYRGGKVSENEHVKKITSGWLRWQAIKKMLPENDHVKNTIVHFILLYRGPSLWYYNSKW